MKNRFISLKIIVIALMFLLGLTPLSIALAAPTSVGISVPPKVHAGEQFTVDINVAPGGAIAGVQFNLAFNPAVVTVNSVAEGNLLSQGGASTYFGSGTINNAAGTVNSVVGVITTPGQSVSSAGTFAVITMTAGPSGTSALTLSDVVVGDVNGQAIQISVVSGQVVVNRPPQLGAVGAKSADEGATLTFTVSASDPDSDHLVISANGLPEGASFDSGTGTFSWTPRYNQAGVYSVHFEVSDGDLTAAEDVAITVVKLYDDWDVNGDGAANVLDMVLVGQRWGQNGLTGWVRADTNEDGTINVLDIILIGQHWTG
jgi:hypothetical protein